MIYLERRNDPNRARAVKNFSPPSSKRMAVYMAVAIFVCEVTDMLILSQLPTMTMLSEAIIDSTILLTLLVPAYFLLYRPFWQEHLLLSEQTTHLSRTLIRTVEDERKRVSHELHDQCGQTLTAMQFGLETLRKSLPENCEDLKLQVVDLNEIMAGLNREIREVIFSLRPALIEQLGLIAAIKELVDEFSRNYPQVEVFQSYNLDDSAMRRIDYDVQLALYRICQECLNNIAKYAQTKEVFVQLDSRNTSVILNMGDKGVGFDPRLKKSPGRQGVGLLGIRERVADLGGRLTLSTEIGKGTFITAELPLGKEV